MNYLIPIAASRHPLVVLGRVFLLLTFLACVTWVFRETILFLQLFEVQQVASPVLPQVLSVETGLP